MSLFPLIKTKRKRDHHPLHQKRKRETSTEEGGAYLFIMGKRTRLRTAIRSERGDMYATHKAYLILLRMFPSVKERKKKRGSSPEKGEGEGTELSSP